MEPFGLFQLLQTLLTPPASAAPAQDQPPTREETPQEAPPPPPQVEQTPAQDAFLHFMQAHETRAKRTKRP